MELGGLSYVIPNIVQPSLKSLQDSHWLSSLELNMPTFRYYWCHHSKFLHKKYWHCIKN